MDKKFPGSIHKELIYKHSSLFSKYASLFLGKRNLFEFVKFELINLLFSWTPGALGFFLRKIFYPCLLKRVGRGTVFGRNITLRHPHKISVGDYTFIDDNVVLDAKGEANEGISIGENVYLGRNTILSCKEGSIFLDDYCCISANCQLISETEIRLGRYSFMAGDCYLVAGGNHPVTDVSTPIMFQHPVSKGGIKIGEDVWLGAGVIVLDGVTIGKGSVIGAASVVAASLPDYTLAVGSRVLKIRDRKQLKDNDSF